MKRPEEDALRLARLAASLQGATAARYVRWSRLWPDDFFRNHAMAVYHAKRAASEALKVRALVKGGAR